ncbi:hypothetical protein ACQEUU_20725 [Nonomuraea sp. CA-218870]|uniref:hypothetical protein n=1 Tax=Nonomuraea sp. CA-218870 TaxID=3239998 RepID=UPI003D8E691D
MISVKLAIDRPGHTPMVLTADEPFVIEADITRFPPRGDRYRLRRPVDMEREYIRDRTLEGHESARARAASPAEPASTDILTQPS